LFHLYRNAVRARLTAEGIIGEDAYVVIAGPANTYAHYITTREEYGVQRYEGASTLFGPSKTSYSFVAPATKAAADHEVCHRYPRCIHRQVFQSGIILGRQCTARTSATVRPSSSRLDVGCNLTPGTSSLPSYSPTDARRCRPDWSHLRQPGHRP